MTFLVLVLHLALAQVSSRPLLAVPFMAQPPALCGGAAVSMVLRYWGLGDVFPQDFAALVSESDGGIFTGVLAKAVTDRGWNALVDPASAASSRTRVSAEIDRGRPVIALIEVSPRTYHYVVIVGATDREVVFHDPARGPFRVMDWTKFGDAWSAAKFWMMVALPPAGFVAPKPATSPPAVTPEAPVRSAPATPCTALVTHAVETALAGETSAAEQELSAAMRLCPADAAGFREMAGLRFSQKRYADANVLATMATRLAPGDEYSWELAATSRYLAGDSDGALAAWNHIGQPRVDAVNIRGAVRTPMPVVSRAAALEPRAILTAGAFTQALRRLRDLPVAATADMKFEPAAAGQANVDVVVVERSPFPRGPASLGVLAARPLFQREVRVETAGIMGVGEAASASWRFADKRPRVAVGLAFPSPPRLPGVTSFSGLWEQQWYGLPGAEPEAFRESRRRAGLQLSDWASAWLKWQAGASADAFNDVGFVSSDVTLTAQSRGNRAAISASAASWFPFSEGRRFTSGSVRANVRSTADAARPVLSSVAEYQRVSEAAPLMVWPGAGTGAGRPALLRAHQLLDHGIVTGAVLGRELVNASVEYAQPVRSIRTLNLSVAAFVDGARASLRRDGLAPTPFHVDAGVGLRLRLPAGLGGIRADVAHTFGDGKMTFSAGWLAAWPK